MASPTLAGRRQFMIVLASLAVVRPVPVRAQPAGGVHRIGFLWDSPAVFADALEAFREGLRELGHEEGRNLVIEYRWSEGRPEKMREQAEELARLNVDVIIAPSSIYTGAAKRATSTIPIVFMSHADPIKTGHVASLARPGGNATGLTIIMTETNVKGLDLKEVPGSSTLPLSLIRPPRLTRRDWRRCALQLRRSACGLPGSRCGAHPSTRGLLRLSWHSASGPFSSFPLPSSRRGRSNSQTLG